MSKGIRLRALLTATAWLALFGSTALLAQQAADEEAFNPGTAIEDIEAMQLRFKDPDANQLTVSEALALVSRLRAGAETCVADTRPEVERLDSELGILPVFNENENIEIWERRNALQTEKSLVEARLSNCELVISRSDGLTAIAEQKGSRLSRQRVMSRGNALWQNGQGKLETANLWPARIIQALKPAPSIDGSFASTWILIALVVLAIGLGFALRYKFNCWYKDSGADERAPEFKYLIPKPLAEYAPILLAGLIAAIVINIYATELVWNLAPFRLAMGILAYGFGGVVIVWSTGPLSPAAEVEGLIPGMVKPVRRRLHRFLLVLVSSFVILGQGWLIDLPEDLDALPRSLLTLFLAFSLLWVLLIARKIPGLMNRFRFTRFVILLVILSSIVAEIFGYHNFASYLTRGIVLSALSGFMIWMLLWLIEQTRNAITTGSSPFAFRTRSYLGISSAEKPSRLGPYQLLIDITVWLGFAALLIWIWDNSGAILPKAGAYITQGFTIGAISIMPLNILSGVIVFTGLLLVTSWIKGLIQRRWVRHMTMDRGARDSMVTLAGYAGFAIASITGLAMIGVSLAGLAWMAAALSVGIGFGLQSIVNNFISGMILLFERPVKVGDFVTVGTVEGFVKRISIRSTEIETLDNQNIFVPNSELVSGQVTNWVLHDPHGRLRIKVGVAYGSDTKLVKEILETAGRDHPEVITDPTRATPPKALFMEFGDSSLNFELRVRIKRIERRYDVTSDINFAIDQAFKEQSITIPFPQRDLHIKTLPPNWPKGD
ncbi:MAG: mechanosensitive ion channel family protein [Proteobacteria bacterium]|nr:mechanosensitive ion channel family protein [Pseudomonadota bacterium]